MRGRFSKRRGAQFEYQLPRTNGSSRTVAATGLSAEITFTIVPAFRNSYLTYASATVRLSEGENVAEVIRPTSAPASDCTLAPDSIVTSLSNARPVSFFAT